MLQPQVDSHPLPQAYLIVDGSQIFPLTGGVVSIGRSPNNDLVIQDRRVSRSHAQLRLVSSRYVIFDLNSTGGTYVNDHPVNQMALYPGDVISLAGVSLVYGQEAGGTYGETQQMPADREL
jgi:pSer/pThr/pTyr-binding forkhead associated (FHA) protein